MKSHQIEPIPIDQKKTITARANENSSNPTEQPTENNCSSMPPPRTLDMNIGRATKRQAVETPKKNTHSETDQVRDHVRAWII